MAVHFSKALAPDRIDELGDRAMIKPIRRLNFLKLQVDVGRVSLVRSDFQPHLVEGESLLIVFGDDPLKLLGADRKTNSGGTGQQLLDGNPTARLQRQAKRLGFMPQVLAEKLADGDEAFVHGFCKRGRSGIRPGRPFRSISESNGLRLRRQKRPDDFTDANSIASNYHG